MGNADPEGLMILPDDMMPEPDPSWIQPCDGYDFGHDPDEGGGGWGLGLGLGGLFPLLGGSLAGAGSLAAGAFRTGLDAASGGHLPGGDDAHHKIPKNPRTQARVGADHGQSGVNQIHDPVRNGTSWPWRHHRGVSSRYQELIDLFFQAHPNYTMDELSDFAKWLSRQGRKRRPPF